MSVNSYDELLAHVGHKVEVVSYGVGFTAHGPRDAANVAVECESCGEVLLDFDRPATDARRMSHRDAIRAYVTEYAEMDGRSIPSLELLGFIDSLDQP